MTFTHELKMTLNNYQGILYKMIELRITADNSIFNIGALSYVLKITDGSNEETGFFMELSGNQKELIVYFTTDAFSGFSPSSEIKFGYAYNPEEFTIGGIDVTVLSTLPMELAIIPHSEANNAWLTSL